MSYNFISNSKPKRKFNILKFGSIVLLLFITFFGVKMYTDYKYDLVISDFYTNFNKSEFDNTNKIIQDNNLLLKVYKNRLNDDLDTYFNGVITTVLDHYDKGSISNETAINLLMEIKKYNVLRTSVDTLIAYLDNSTISNNNNNATNSNSSDINNTNIESTDLLSQGINYLNNKDFINAYDSFVKITSDNKDFKNAQTYISKTKVEYKNYLLNTADELIFNKYFTKAIDTLSNYDTRILSKDDKDIAGKINSTTMFKEEYLADKPVDDSLYTSGTILSSITANNINTLNIDSQTPYFVYLSLNEQKTYIYEGSLNNWQLIKTFDSSTGLPGKETPVGIFTINDRGDWFFSEEFEQGGKYWVKFMGDYLFHSLPYNRDQSQVLDYTLGKPASHGCVRLTVEDSKWLYDNIPNDTKVLIN